LLDRHVARYSVPPLVSLQGEGEPTINPDFFRMAVGEKATVGVCRRSDIAPQAAAETKLDVGEEPIKRHRQVALDGA
jgi:hypothetical protein